MNQLPSISVKILGKNQITCQKWARSYLHVRSGLQSQIQDNGNWSSFYEWDEDIFVIKRTASQLLSEFMGRQKIRLVEIGVSRLKERDSRQTLITDFL